MTFAYTKPEARLSKIQTPINTAIWLYKLTKHLKPIWILDPCVGEGNLLEPWFGCFYKKIQTPTHFIGVDIDSQIKATRILPFNFAFYGGHFELSRRPDYPDGQPLVLCNPPFNGHWNRKHYPEVFLRKILELFGNDVPIVFCCPMGFRLNQSKDSSRYKWMRDEGPKITSIISCPRDLYSNTEFHTEILLFNIKRVKSHYWLPEEAM